ncbi:MAG TPA: glycosyltransferase WbuB [Acidobacteriaceae bacterium]
MHILIYGLNYAPELTGIGKYTGEMSDWLAARGHKVTVVTAPPYYPAWRVREDYRSSSYRVEKTPGKATVFRVPLWVPERPTGVKRVLHLASFMLSSLPAMLLQPLFQPDVVWTVEPTFFSAPIALGVARFCGAKAWLHVQDFEIDAAFDLGLLPADGLVHRMALGLELLFTRGFDRVSSISPRMVERALTKEVEPQHALLFPNWVDVEAVYPMEGVTRYRRELGLEDKIVVMYSGNLGTKQGLECLAPLAKAFAEDAHVHFLFCGDGSFRPLLETEVAGLENVTLLPLQPVEMLNELLNTADVHLLPQRAGAADLVMPSKLTGMLASGRPVLATAEKGTQVADVVEGRGVVVGAESPQCLVKALHMLTENGELRAQMGAEARAYAVEHMGREQVLRRFERDLLDVVAGVVR